jgi:soluble lytic murein transglycosylase-like protein
MTGAPVLRSAALQRQLALTPVRPPTPVPTSGFAATLATAQSHATTGPSAVRTVGTSSALAPHGVLGTYEATSLAPTDVSGPIPYLAEITAAANKYGVDPALLAGLVKTESNFTPKAQSGVGAKGLTQLMDATAKGLGVTNSFDVQQSLDGGAKFLGGLLKQFHGDQSLALAAYNAGPGAVQKYGGIPPYQETQRYVPKVLECAARFRRIIATA